MAQGGSGTTGGGRPAAAEGGFGLDHIFGLAFGAMRRGAAGFVLLFLIGFVLAAVLGGIVLATWYEVADPATGMARDPSGEAWLAAVGLAVFLAYIVAFLLLHLVAVGLAYAVLRHEPLPLRRLFALARRRFWPALATAIVATLGILGGTILFIVPGIVLAIIWFVWSPACLVEGSGTGASLRRSRELTKGLRWTIFWMWLITMLVSGALHQVGESLSNWHAAFGLLIALTYGFTSIFWACLIAAVYVALREREGGTGLPDLVAALR